MNPIHYSTLKFAECFKSIMNVSSIMILLLSLLFTSSEYILTSSDFKVAGLLAIFKITGLCLNLALIYKKSNKIQNASSFCPDWKGTEAVSIRHT